MNVAIDPEKKAIIARKIVEGFLITEEEFETAKATNMYRQDAEYVDLRASYYREPKGRFGYICLKHETATEESGTMKVDGQDVEFQCGFGLHVPDLLWKHLSYENLGLLVARFGKDIVDRIPRKRGRNE